MAIQFECSDCGESLRVKEKYAGRKLRCPECDTVLKIPAADDDGEADFYHDDEEAEERPVSRSSSSARASKSKSQSTRSGAGRKKRADEGDNFFQRSKTKKSKKSKAANSNAVLIWSLVIGGGVLGLGAVATVVMVAMSWSSGTGQPTVAAAKQSSPAPKAAANPQYVTVETETPVAKFKMVWDMPAKWTQQSGVEDGFWPWAEMKGQGQTMKISSNRSLTEASSTMTSVGGFDEVLKTAHTVRLAKLQLEYNEFSEGPLTVHDGKYGPVVWSEYEYKGMFGKGYGIRCTLPGPRLPCTLVMEYALSARDKWRPIVLDVASSVHFKKNKKDGDSDDGGDDFFMDDGD